MQCVWQAGIEFDNAIVVDTEEKPHMDEGWAVYRAGFTGPRPAPSEQAGNLEVPQCLLPESLRVENMDADCLSAPMPEAMKEEVKEAEENFSTETKQAGHTGTESATEPPSASLGTGDESTDPQGIARSAHERRGGGSLTSDTPDSDEEETPELAADTSPPLAPSLQALEAGRRSEAEGLVYKAYFARGLELEAEFQAAATSYAAARTTRAAAATAPKGMSA